MRAADDTATISPGPAKAVIYARVSSKEQEKEGFSIPAQLKLLNEYAAAQMMAVAHEYVDIETAKQTGRTQFSAMIAHLRAHPHTRTVLVEKTDRLYRNLKDWVTLDDLDIEIHFVKEGITLSRNSRSSEKFVHGIKVLMAKNYIDNLSEEARKGQMEKAEQGIWPTKAPLGYCNGLGPDGKRIIIPDPVTGPIVSDIFEWYATGHHSVRDVAEKAQALGLTYKRTGAPVPVSAIHTMLRNRIYYGEFEWNGRLCRGRHEPLVTYEIWERTQNILEGRQCVRPRRTKWDFAFSGVMTCGHCGCAMVGEMKKGRYVYYHCTGFKGKCNEPYVRQEVIEAEFARVLQCLHFDEDLLAEIKRSLLDSLEVQKRDHSAAIVQARADYDQLQQRLHALYIDKLDGRIEPRAYEKMSRQWRDEQERCLRAIARHQAADQSNLEKGVRIIELAHGARDLFAKKPAPERRRLLSYLLSNSTWKDGRLSVSFAQPFDLIAETVAKEAADPVPEGTVLAERPVWLGD